jgi:hypothetical protein
VLVGGEKGINVIDNPPTGKSPGDVRAGWRKLADENGNAMGSVQFVATLTEPGAVGGDILAGQYSSGCPTDTSPARPSTSSRIPPTLSQKAQNAVLVVTGAPDPMPALGEDRDRAGEAPRYVSTSLPRLSRDPRRFPLVEDGVEARHRFVAGDRRDQAVGLPR